MSTEVWIYFMFSLILVEYISMCRTKTQALQIAFNLNPIEKFSSSWVVVLFFACLIRVAFMTKRWQRKNSFLVPSLVFLCHRALYLNLHVTRSPCRAAGLDSSALHLLFCCPPQPSAPDLPELPENTAQCPDPCAATKKQNKRAVCTDSQEAEHIQNMFM